jgi:hypothetical protein
MIAQMNITKGFFETVIYAGGALVLMCIACLIIQAITKRLDD